MNYYPLVPDQTPLAGAIETIFILDGYKPDHPRERLVPNGRMTLVIELDGRVRHVYDNETGEPLQSFRGAWFSGVQSQYLTIGDTKPGNRLLAVQFAPGHSKQFTHRDASTFNDAVVPADDAFDSPIDDLRSALLACRDESSMLTLAEDWLAGCHEESLEPPQEVTLVTRRLLENPGAVRLTELVGSETSISYKHFVNLFRRHVGPTAKTMQRILRFSRVFEFLQAANTKGSHIDWAMLSLELGYADQAHFIRDFGRFSGYRPGDFQAEGHDRVNFFPENDSA